MTARVSARKLAGKVEAVSSKSQLQRQIICAMLSEGETVIRYRSMSGDIRAALRCAEALGAVIHTDDKEITVRRGTVPREEITLDCGMSAAVARFMLPVAAALHGDFTLTGCGSLLNRPMDGLTDVLSARGCKCCGNALPMRVIGRLSGGDLSVPVGSSSQYLSGLLLASPLLNGCRIYTKGSAVSRPYIDMTVAEMKRFGVRVTETDGAFIIPEGQRYISPGTAQTEGDWSAAAVWLCASALNEGQIQVTGLSRDSLQGDRAIVQYIPMLLADGDKQIDLSDTPDLFPVLAVLASAATGETEFSHIARLRSKESDRIESVQRLLAALGGRTKTETDTFTVYGTKLHGGAVNACGDHRIAMAAALAAVLCGESIEIADAECVDKSYPGFWEDYEALGGCVQWS